MTYSDVTTKILKIYLSLLRDVKCLSSDLFLSLPKVISSLTVMYLKKVSELNRQEEASEILQTLVRKIQNNRKIAENDATYRHALSKLHFWLCLK